MWCGAWLGLYVWCGVWVAVSVGVFCGWCLNYKVYVVWVVCVTAYTWYCMYVALCVCGVVCWVVGYVWCGVGVV